MIGDVKFWIGSGDDQLLPLLSGRQQFVKLLDNHFFIGQRGRFNFCRFFFIDRLTGRISNRWIVFGRPFFCRIFYYRRWLGLAFDSFIWLGRLVGQQFELFF